MEENRLQELIDFFKPKMGENYSEEIPKKVLEIEQRAVENREHLEFLLDREILTMEEYKEKVNLCVQVLVKEAAEILGEELCRDFYDFGPDDKITLLY